MKPKIPTITDDEIRAWFTETKHKRPWLAALLSAKPGSVDQWFSKGFPDWAKTIIALYRENQSNPNLLQLRFNPEEWATIQSAMRNAGYIEQFEFFRDAIVAFAARINKHRAAVWECFCDPSYYDMWCVRRKHERKFGQGFHINNGKEAQALTDLLNENEVA